MGFFNPVSVVKTFDVPASAGTVNNYLSINETPGFSIQKISNAEFIFLANMSLGTITMGGIRPKPVTNGIQTRVILTAINKSKCAVTLKTKLRFELILTIAAWTTVTLYQIIAKPAFPFWITTIFFPVVLVFQLFLYRIQETILQNKAKSYLLAFKG